MRIIEHRRHTMRTKPGEHLSQDGVELARSVGNGLGPFSLVITSTVARAFETAIAMGFAVNEQIDELDCYLPDGFEQEVAGDYGCLGILKAIDTSPEGVVARFAQAMAKLHQEIANRLEDGGTALVISHGGVVEASAIGCLPSVDFSAWDPSWCDYCEGFRVYVEQNKFLSVEPLRVKQFLRD